LVISDEAEVGDEAIGADFLSLPRELLDRP
jgi:hypothetical protein